MNLQIPPMWLRGVFPGVSEVASTWLRYSSPMRGLGLSVSWEGFGDRIWCLGLAGGIWWGSVGDEALASSSSKAGWRADGGLVYNTSSGVRSTSSSPPPPPPPPLPQLAPD